MLLERQTVPIVQAVERLAGIQAQLPRWPLVALWSRVAGFKRRSFLDLVKQRQLVRATMMRATLHLVSVDHYVRYRRSIQPALTAGMTSIARSRGVDHDYEPIIAAAQREFERKPQTFAELRKTLAQQFPNIDERAMGYIARTALPLVMMPDDSEFGYSTSTFVSAKAWLGQEIDYEDRTDDLILQYLAAFGPASVRDAETWSGLRLLNPSFERLRPRLRAFRDAARRELFDLPDAPRPDEKIPVPVRFLPGFDSTLLAHAARTRIIADEHRPYVSLTNLQVLPTFLVDGFVAGVWEIACRKRSTTVTISPFIDLRTKNKRELIAEGEALAHFLNPQAASAEVLFKDEPI